MTSELPSAEHFLSQDHEYYDFVGHFITDHHLPRRWAPECETTRAGERLRAEESTYILSRFRAYRSAARCRRRRVFDSTRVRGTAAMQAICRYYVNVGLLALITEITR